MVGSSRDCHFQEMGYTVPVGLIMQSSCFSNANLKEKNISGLTDSKKGLMVAKGEG